MPLRNLLGQARQLNVGIFSTSALRPPPNARLSCVRDRGKQGTDRQRAPREGSWCEVESNAVYLLRILHDDHAPKRALRKAVSMSLIATAAANAQGSSAIGTDSKLRLHRLQPFADLFRFASIARPQRGGLLAGMVKSERHSKSSSDAHQTDEGPSCSAKLILQERVRAKLKVGRIVNNDLRPNVRVRARRP